MTVYGDTSCLVKLYVLEEGHAEIRTLAARASAVVTSAIAYVEMLAALARLRRERRLTPAAYRIARQQFDLDWPGVVAIDLTDAIRSAAGDLADRHALRALDAIHLASFVHLLRSSPDDVEFSSFDDRLVRAARRLR